jgi:predicted MFS family arabinose efflux permease
VSTGLTLVVVLHLRLAEGRSTLAAGLTLLPWSLGLGVASMLAGSRLFPRYGASALLRPGLFIVVAGLLGAIVRPSALLVWLALLGLGAGLFATAFFTVALHPVRPEDNGLAAGQLNAVQQLGATLGVAALGRAYLHTGHLAPPLWLAIAVLLVLALVPIATTPGK